ncbi:MAG TPA: FAD:protein FMN transferase, partial [Polyangiales bacterium]
MSVWIALSACEKRAGEAAAGDRVAPTNATPAPAPPPPSAAAQPVTPGEAAPEPPLLAVQRTREMMGTIIQMTIIGVPEERAAPALGAAMAEIARLEGLLSEWREDSEISQINRAAGKHPVKVSEDTLANVRVSNEVSKWSDGAFDLSWAALRGLYLFRPGEERVPTDK